MDEIAVLNGTVCTGDTIAYAVRVGNEAAMRIGVIEEIVERHRNPLLRVRITRAKEDVFGNPIGKIVSLTHPDRIVLLVKGAIR